MSKEANLGEPSRAVSGANKRGNSRNSGYDRVEDDWYAELPSAVEALLSAETFEGPIWDPACGGGNIPKTCATRGYASYGTDIAYRGFGPTQSVDFLSTLCRDNVGSIICNPPFRPSVDFVLRGLECATDKVAILQRTAWLEGDDRWKRLFSLNRLMRVHQFRDRISIPPGGRPDITASGGSIPFAWFVFSRKHNGPPILGWISTKT